MAAFDLVLSGSSPRVSPRNGKLPRSLASALKEETNPAYRDRKERARKMLAEDMLKNGRDTLAGLRLLRGMSQHQLAAAVGTSQPHIAKIEAGAFRIYLDTAIRLADALNVSLDELRPLIRLGEYQAKIVTSES